jgi:hypothetical protein
MNLKQAPPLGTKFPFKSEGSLSGLLGDVLRVRGSPRLQLSPCPTGKGTHGANREAELNRELLESPDQLNRMIHIPSVAMKRPPERAAERQRTGTWPAPKRILSPVYLVW